MLLTLTFPELLTDSVVHSKLLYKLHNIGIGGNLYKWISQFLTARSQCTVVENEFSAITDVISGVIQGSCLGPCHGGYVRLSPFLVVTLAELPPWLYYTEVELSSPIISV